jgi:cell division protein FtsL
MHTRQSIIRSAIAAAVLLLSLIINIICLASVIQMGDQVKHLDQQVKARDARIEALQEEVNYKDSLIFR